MLIEELLEHHQLFSGSSHRKGNTTSHIKTAALFLYLGLVWKVGSFFFQIVRYNNFVTCKLQAIEGTDHFNFLESNLACNPLPLRTLSRSKKIQVETRRQRGRARLVGRVLDKISGSTTAHNSRHNHAEATEPSF